MIYLAAAVSLVLFAWSLRRSGAAAAAGGAIGMTRDAFATLRNRALSDDEKERAARVFSVRLLIQGVAILGRLMLAVMPPLAFLLLLLASGLVAIPSLIAVLESWMFLLIATVAVGATLFWR